MEHNHADCTGRWHLTLIGDGLFWRCTACLVIEYHTKVSAEAALRENRHDAVLRSLTDAGQQMLEQEREP